MGNTLSINIMKAQLASHKELINSLGLEELIHLANNSTISLDDQMHCARDIKKLQMTVYCLVKKLKKVTPAVAPMQKPVAIQPPNEKGNIISEKV